MKLSTVANTSGIVEITKHFDDHIGICKMKDAYSGILREDNFSFEMFSMEEVNKVVLRLNSRKIFYVWCHPCQYPKTNNRISFETSDKHYQSFFKTTHFS